MKMGKGAGMRTGKQNGVGFGGSPAQVNSRPRLTSYREGVIAKPATSNKTPSGGPKSGDHGKKSSC